MKQVKKDTLLVTRPAQTDQEAITAKMKALNPRLFGLFNPVPYKLLAGRKVYIPYELMVFSYMIRSIRNSDSKALSRFDRTGEIGIIFDLNEVHGFHFDLNEELDLESLGPEKTDGEILSDQCTEEAALEKAKDLICYRYLNRPFKNIELNLIKRLKFYRKAWELTVEANGKEMQRYAYIDTYGASNEHVSGLRLRLNM